MPPGLPQTQVLLLERRVKTLLKSLPIEFGLRGSFGDDLGRLVTDRSLLPLDSSCSLFEVESEDPVLDKRGVVELTVRDRGVWTGSGVGGIMIIEPSESSGLGPSFVGINDDGSSSTSSATSSGISISSFHGVPLVKLLLPSGCGLSE